MEELSSTVEEAYAYLPILRKLNIAVLWFPDMQKFPLRMKDNDLLVTELYRDPSNDPITAISVYLTPKTSKLVFICRLIMCSGT